MSKLTRWLVIDSSTAPIRDGEEVIFGMVLRCLDTGSDYIVTVSGTGATPGPNFSNALQAAAQHVASSIGLDAPPTVSLERKH